jgi:hypothetical protein
MEHCGGKSQFITRSGALIPWTILPQVFLLLDLKILDFYEFNSVSCMDFAAQDHRYLRVCKRTVPGGTNLGLRSEVDFS